MWNYNGQNERFTNRHPFDSRLEGKFDSKGNRLSNPYSTCLAWRCNGELTKKGVSTP